MADGRLLPYPLASWSRTNKTQVFLRATLVQPQPVSEQSSLTVTWAKVGSRPSLLGCFVDNQTRDLPVNAGDSPQGNSPADCSSKCVGWAFFGLQSATNWWVLFSLTAPRKISRKKVPTSRSLLLPTASVATAMADMAQRQCQTATGPVQAIRASIAAAPGATASTSRICLPLRFPPVLTAHKPFPATT